MQYNVIREKNLRRKHQQMIEQNILIRTYAHELFVQNCNSKCFVLMN